MVFLALCRGLKYLFITKDHIFLQGGPSKVLNNGIDRPMGEPMPISGRYLIFASKWIFYQQGVRTRNVWTWGERRLSSQNRECSWAEENVFYKEWVWVHVD